VEKPTGGSSKIETRLYLGEMKLKQSGQHSFNLEEFNK
jgi:hypothetical protein